MGLRVFRFWVNFLIYSAVWDSLEVCLHMSRPKGSGTMALKNVKEDGSKPRGKMTAYAFFVQVKHVFKVPVYP